MHTNKKEGTVLMLSLNAIDSLTDGVLMAPRPNKAPSNYAPKAVVYFIEESGCLQIIIQCDNELSLVALMRK